MESNAKILQDLMNASKFLNLNEFESDLTNLLKNLDQKETDLKVFFTEVKNNVTKCLEYQIEKKNQVEKELKSMSDELVFERQKCKEYFDEIQKLKNELKNFKEKNNLYNQAINEINSYKAQNEQLNEKITSLKSQLDELKKNKQNQEKDFLENILDLKSYQQSCINENERLKQENLNFVEDIKTILEEKDQVLTELESERIEKAKLKNELSNLNKKECFINEYKNKIFELNSKLDKYALENERLNKLNLLLQNDYGVLKQKLKSNLEHVYQLQLKETLKLLENNLKTDHSESLIPANPTANVQTLNSKQSKRENSKENRYSQPPSIVNLMTLNFPRSKNNETSNTTFIKDTSRSINSGRSSILVIYPDSESAISRVKHQVSKYEEILK